MSKSVAFSAPDTLRFLAGLDAVGANHGNVKLLKTFWARVAEKQVTWYFTESFLSENFGWRYFLCAADVIIDFASFVIRKQDGTWHGYASCIFMLIPMWDLWDHSIPFICIYNNNSCSIMSHPFLNFGWIFSIPFQPTARTNFNKQFKFGSWCSFWQSSFFTISFGRL